MHARDHALRLAWSLPVPRPVARPQWLPKCAYIASSIIITTVVTAVTVIISTIGTVVYVIRAVNSHRIEVRVKVMGITTFGLKEDGAKVRTGKRAELPTSSDGKAA